MTLNIAGKLIDFSTPQVMGIINVTPDSFYAGSRTPMAPGASGGASAEGSVLVQRAEEMVAQGAAILDIGACSTRPGSAPVSADEELRRLDAALTALAPLRTLHPDILISIDTFRADVARRCVRDHGIHIINDISAGQLDNTMFATVAELRTPYILMHNPSPDPTSPSSSTLAPAASPSSAFTLGGFPADSSPFLPSVARFFAERLSQLYALGVADVILDPGFGFGKTLEENYALLHHLHDLIRLFPDNPFLIALSRKSMIYRLLGITPDEALNGTTVLHTLALQAGAHLLRVHDVRPAVEAIRLVQYTLNVKH